MKTHDISCGTYQHYKNKKLYEVIGIARHTETHEEMVIYKALYECDKFEKDQIWVRPAAMFVEQLNIGGQSVSRFKRVDQLNQPTLKAPL